MDDLKVKSVLGRVNHYLLHGDYPHLDKSEFNVVAQALQRCVAPEVARPGDARMIPNDEWEQCVRILMDVRDFLHSNGFPEQYNATIKLRQGMADLERIVGSPLFGASQPQRGSEEKP